MPKLHFSWRRAGILTMLFAGISLILSGCDLFNTSQDESLSDSYSIKSIVLKVAYENKPNEPIDIGMKRWQIELEARSFGTMKLELYPDSKLGNKDEVLRRIANGENIITIADGAFFSSLGQKQMGITFGPYLVSNWKEAFNVSRSPWYQRQTLELAARTGIKTISVDWAYGVRHLLTTKPVNSIKDLQGLKIRVPSNLIQEKTFEVFGAVPVKMPLSEVGAALSSGQIDGLENPVSTLYYGNFHKYATNLTLTAHVFNVANIVLSQKQWLSLNASQQKMLVDSCNRAAKFYNAVQSAEELTVMKKLKEEGVTISLPSQDLLRGMREGAKNFYNLPEFAHDWPSTLYTNIQRIKGRKSPKHVDLMSHSGVLNVSYSTPEELNKEIEQNNTESSTDNQEDQVESEANESTSSINPTANDSLGLEHYSTNNEHSGISGEVYYIPLQEEETAPVALEENPPKDNSPIWNPAKDGPKYTEPDVPIVAPLGDEEQQNTNTTESQPAQSPDTDSQVPATPQQPQNNNTQQENIAA